MAMGERLKMARRIAGMSMRALAEGAGVSAMAISKYEHDLMTPGSDVLLRLARALDVKTGFLLRPVTATLTTAPSFRCKASLGARERAAILAKTQAWLERYLDVESLVADAPLYAPPAIDCRVTTLEDVERVALALREAWDLGLDPIDNLVEVLERKGIKVGIIDGVDDFDALTLWANETVPVIVVKGGLPGDRQRLSLAHELGHLVLAPGAALDEEKEAYRFAGAFLVPRPMAIYELGKRRRELDLVELHMLKYRYGVSMQAWIYRALDLGIISQATTTNLWKRFRAQGWRKVEPGNPIPQEVPERLERLVLRALAENVITDSRASELLDRPLAEFWKEQSERYAGFPALGRP
ncbi:MAG: XRE family transcriptional regulator [Armatimonadetes bacterium]|nr:XRE family transcriptional regulator [Armatimonadota bacterium]